MQLHEFEIQLLWALLLDAMAHLFVHCSDLIQNVDNLQHATA